MPLCVGILLHRANLRDWCKMCYLKQHILGGYEGQKIVSYSVLTFLL